MTAPRVTPGGETPPQDELLKRAVADRDARPWNYYRLEHETMKRLLNELTDALDARTRERDEAVKFGEAAVADRLRLGADNADLRAQLASAKEVWTEPQLRMLYHGLEVQYGAVCEKLTELRSRLARQAH